MRKNNRFLQKLNQNLSLVSFKKGFLSVLLLGMLVFASIGGVMLMKLDQQLRNNFEGRRWQLPTKVYARPLELYVGSLIGPQDLVQELELLGYRPVEKVAEAGTYKKTGQQFEISTRGFKFGDGVELPTTVQVVFRRGEIVSVGSGAKDIDLLRLEPMLIGGIFGVSMEDRQLIQLSAVPESVINTLLAVEDRRFFEHNGVSFKGLFRALLANIKEGEIVQGGSTITQQLVKNLYLSRERTYSRKLKELVMAMLLEAHYSKEEILETYLNEIYMGQQGSKAIHGFGLASEFYFGQPLNTLAIDQVALLVGMVKGPSLYHPLRNPERALKRRGQVLQILFDSGQISHEVLQQYSVQPLRVLSTRSALNPFPAFLDLVKQQLSSDYSQEDLQSEGLRVFTTLDPLVQTRAAAAMDKVVADLEQSKKSNAQNAKIQGASLVTSPNNGEVLAVVGSARASDFGFNRAIQAKRQVGSIIKPAVLLAALEHEDLYQLWTPLIDEPFVLEQPNGESWQPKNFDHQSHGQVIMQEALVHSYNQAIARLALDIGIEAVVDVVQRLGIDRDLPALPSLSLGAVEMTPLEVTKMYQTIAANGFSSPLQSIREVLDAKGDRLKRYPLEVKQVIADHTMSKIQYALQQVVSRGTASGIYRGSVLPTDLGLAGKTGTSNESRDSWFAGMSGNYLSVVWLGNDDNLPIGLTGASGAMRVWRAFMVDSTVESFHPVRVNQLNEIWVDLGSGAQSKAGCPNSGRVISSEAYLPEIVAPCARSLLQRWLDRWGPGQRRPRN